MELLSLNPTDLPYRQSFGTDNISQFDVYTEQQSLVNPSFIGKVIDVLVDASHRSYYLAVDQGMIPANKQFILPLTTFKIVPEQQRIYISGLNQTQLQNLPVYTPSQIQRYEGNRDLQTQPILREPAVGEPAANYPNYKVAIMAPLENSVPLEAARPLELPNSSVAATAVSGTSSLPNLASSSEILPSSSNEFKVEPTAPAATVPEAFPHLTTQETHSIQLLAERLLVDRHRHKVGEVVVRKVVETQMVEVPIRRERLIIDQISPEPKQLAAIDLGRGALSQVELNQIVANLSDSVDNSATAAPSHAISVAVALQILQKVLNTPRFNQSTVQLVFSDSELQAHYQYWLAEHRQ